MQYSNFNTIKRRNTNYVFTFGDTGVGKSTLLASISKFFSERAVLSFNSSNQNGSNMLIGNWLKKLKKREFPPRSREGDIIEVDLGLEFVEGEGDTLKLTFLEMSGEDLRSIDMVSGKGKLEEKFIQYIKQTETFLVVTDVEEAEDDDDLIWQFLCHLIEHGGENISIALVINKWDLLKENYTLQEFVMEKMKITSNWLHSDNFNDVSVFSFSIGKPIKSEDDTIKIEAMNVTGCQKIVEWMYQTF